MSKHLSHRRESDPGNLVGKSVRRVDAVPKVTGRATYTMDKQPGNLLHAKLVTSQVAHARLVDVDTTAAEAMPGVAAVATEADVPDTRRGAYILDQPILARNKVRYVSDPIAVVAAETPALAEEAVRKVDVEYQPLDPVFDLEEAFARDPPGVVHENVQAYEFATQGDPRYGKRGHVSDDDASRPNLLYKDADERGNVSDGFDEADHIVEGTYRVNPIQHCSMENRVAIAHAEHDGLKIWTSHQVPHNVEKNLCTTYPDLSRSDVTVESPYVGGGFGGKITAYLETMLVAVARLVPRPVRLQLIRSEEFTSGISRPEVITTVKDGITEDGDIVARDVEMLFNCGAYNEQVFRAAVATSDQVYGAYNVPNLRWNSYAVYTNRPMYGAFRGFGKPEVNWAIERNMDKAAREVGLDPLEFRARNLLREGDLNAIGEVLGPNDTEACLREPVNRLRDLDLETEFPEYASEEWSLGLGFAYGVKSIARAAGTVTMEVCRDMEVAVAIGASDIGQGSDTVFTQFAADEFDIDVERVSLVTGNTSQTPYTRGPTGSRFTYHTGHAIQRAAADLKQQIAALAAEQFGSGVAATDLTVTGEHVVVADDPERSIHINDLFTDYDHEHGVSRTVLASGGELIGTASYDARDGPGKHAAWTPIGQAAIVAVNQLTGETEVLRFCSACDVGRAVNPKNVEQQLEGGAAQGISTALYEEIVYDGGHVFNPNFKDYRVPTATEVPYQSETIILESNDDTGPDGAKGVGEAGMIASAPAVGNAVVDALEEDFDTLPLSPERVLESLTED
jgi:CO/xanthine dehydrogenase Mo-binding subunit